jgi:uncharacterized protein (DUF1778 family)
MPKDSSPLCFRINADDRRLLEAVAAFGEQSVSEFVREAALRTAQTIVDKQGADTILRALLENNDRLAAQQKDVYRIGLQHTSVMDNRDRQTK